MNLRWVGSGAISQVVIEIDLDMLLAYPLENGSITKNRRKNAGAFDS